MCEGTGQSRTRRRAIARSAVAGLALLILAAAISGAPGEATGREAHPVPASGRGTDTADIPGQVLTPAARIRVSVMNRAGRVMAQAVTQADGSYDIPGEEPAGPYELRIHGSDQGLDAGDVPFVTNGKDPQELDCRILTHTPAQCVGWPAHGYQKPVWVFGKILKPAAGARIQVYDGIDVVRSATANVDGRFVIRGIRREHTYDASVIPTPAVPYPSYWPPRITFAVRPQILNLGAHYNGGLLYSPGPGYLPEHRQMLAEADSGDLIGAAFSRLGGVQVRLRDWAGDRVGAVVPDSETITGPDGKFRITKDLGRHIYVLDFGPPSLSILDAVRSHPITGTGNAIDPLTGSKTDGSVWKRWPAVGNKSGIDCTIFPMLAPQCVGSQPPPDRYFPPLPNGVTGFVGGPLIGVKVMLVDSSGKVVRTAITDADGLYRIPAIGTGEYCLRTITDPDWIVDPVEVTMSPYELNLVIVPPLGREDAHLEWHRRYVGEGGPSLFDRDFLSDKAGSVCHKLGLNYVEPVY